MSEQDAREALRERLAEALDVHDWLTPRGYAWPCCDCGQEFPDGEDAARAHQAAALLPVVEEYAVERTRTATERAEAAEAKVAVLERIVTGVIPPRLRDPNAPTLSADELLAELDAARAALDGPQEAAGGAVSASEGGLVPEDQPDHERA